MANVTVRNLPPETHRALKLRAAQHGRSTEAEIRIILQNAVQPKVGIGTALAAIGRTAGGVDFRAQRDRSAVKKATFE
ncbi:MAG: plasmid stability protein [Clostridia bacterium]|nr:plasmid stability protein [Deltaproteobacteria bacterium]